MVWLCVYIYIYIRRFDVDVLVVLLARSILRHAVLFCIGIPKVALFTFQISNRSNVCRRLASCSYPRPRRVKGVVSEDDVGVGRLVVPRPLWQRHCRRLRWYRRVWVSAVSKVGPVLHHVCRELLLVSNQFKVIVEGERNLDNIVTCNVYRSA